METSPDTLKNHEFIISFHVDENSITRKAEEACVRAVERTFDDYFNNSRSYHYSESRFYELVKEAIKDLVEENRQLIIDKSIENITKRMCATKDLRKKCGEIKSRGLNGDK